MVENVQELRSHECETPFLHSTIRQLHTHFKFYNHGREKSEGRFDHNLWVFKTSVMWTLNSSSRDIGIEQPEDIT